MSLPDRNDRLWVTYDIRPNPTGGYSWSVEGIGPRGFNQQALGHTSTLWGARRKIRRYVEQWKEGKAV